METFSVLLAICVGNSPVTGEFPTQRPVTRSSDVFFDLRLNRQLNKQWWGRWFETLSRPLWRHCNIMTIYNKESHGRFTRRFDISVYPNNILNETMGGCKLRPFDTHVTYCDVFGIATVTLWCAQRRLKSPASRLFVQSFFYRGKHQSSASLTFVKEIHRRLVDSPHKWPVTPKRFPFDDAIMIDWFYPCCSGCTC